MAETQEKKLLNKRYQLEDYLEKGGMATVYRGRDLMLERDVAIKLLREDYSRDPAFRERFRQEAKAAANLSHSNIVTVYDFGFDEDHLFIVMEYVPGTDLNSLIKKKGRYSLEEGVPLVIQACKGLGYAHRAGLVHCDIKPHNFLVTPDKRLKVTDFGIARALASIHPDEEADVVWGSPQYFSPEQAAGNAPSPASDVYSMGVILYQMFTGQLPFDSKNAADLAGSAHMDPFADLGTRADQCVRIDHCPFIDVRSRVDVGGGHDHHSHGEVGPVANARSPGNKPDVVVKRQSLKGIGVLVEKTELLFLGVVDQFSKPETEDNPFLDPVVNRPAALRLRRFACGTHFSAVQKEFQLVEHPKGGSPVERLRLLIEVQLYLILECHRAYACS